MVKHHQWVSEKKSALISLPPGHWRHETSWKFESNNIMRKRHNFQTASPRKVWKKRASRFHWTKGWSKFELHIHFWNYYLELQGWKFISRWYLILSSSLHHSSCCMFKHRHIWPASHFSPSLPVCQKTPSFFRHGKTVFFVPPLRPKKRTPVRPEYPMGMPLVHKPLLRSRRASCTAWAAVQMEMKNKKFGPNLLYHKLP